MPRAGRRRSSCDSSSTTLPTRRVAHRRAPAARTTAARSDDGRHEPPSTPCRPRSVRTRRRRAAAARGPARRLPAPATDRLGGAGRRVPGRRRGGAGLRFAERRWRRRWRRRRARERGSTAMPAVEGTLAAPGLVVLRVYDADVPGESIARELEAMSADASGTLPGLLDVASLDDGRCCLVVERLGGPAAVANHRRAHPEPGRGGHHPRADRRGGRRAGAHRVRARAARRERRPPRRRGASEALGPGRAAAASRRRRRASRIAPQRP